MVLKKKKGLFGLQFWWLAETWGEDPLGVKQHDREVEGEADISKEGNGMLLVMLTTNYMLVANYNSHE